MHISTKGRFAVNALVDLALREAAGPVALVSIGQRQGISLSYLEQLFGRLRRVGVVESTRGPGGDYTLARDAASITTSCRRWRLRWTSRPAWLPARIWHAACGSN